MKYDLHVPVEQYGFVNGVLDTDDVTEVRTAYERIKDVFAEKPANTLEDKEMTDFLFAQIHGLGNHIETYERMNAAQKTFINQLKKALARKKQ